MRFPFSKDVKGVAQHILRLHHFYALTLDQVLEGLLITNSSDSFTNLDFFLTNIYYDFFFQGCQRGGSTHFKATPCLRSDVRSRFGGPFNNEFIR